MFILGEVRAALYFVVGAAIVTIAVLIAPPYVPPTEGDPDGNLLYHLDVGRVVLLTAVVVVAVIVLVEITYRRQLRRSQRRAKRRIESQSRERSRRAVDPYSS